MNALGIVVLLGIVHTTIVALVTLIARLAVSRRLPAGRAAVNVAGIACILLVTGLAVVPMPEVWPNSHGRKATPSVMTGAPSESAAHSSDKLRIAQSGTRLDASAADESEASVMFPLQLLRKLGDGMEQATLAVEDPAPGWRWPMLAVLLAGSTISIVRLLLAVGAVRRLRGASRPIEDEVIIGVMSKLTARCGCRFPIEVRESDQLSTAAACGWSRPVVLLPTDWREWSDLELHSVLAHEVAHVRRADYIQRLVALLGAAIYFYHPFVRALARQLAIDQELAADRLARKLGASEHAYTQGLARLALRYHDSLQDRRRWSSVSIMPRSSDFLARRLEMLREKKDDAITSRTARIVPFGVVVCLVAIAFVTTLLRGDVAADEPGGKTPASEAKPIEKVARLPVTDVAEGEPKVEAKPAAELFRRAAFDPSMIRPGSHGAFLFRVGELMRHPELHQHAEGINTYYTEVVQQFMSGMNGAVDLREIEWIAGDLIFTVKGPERKGDTNSRIILGSGGMVIRTTEPGVSLDAMIKAVPGATRKEYEGKKYVQFPVLPAIGPVPVRVRVQDEKTLIFMLGTREDVRPVDAEEKQLQRFFDDTPKQHEWAADWKAVDGGVVTLLVHNCKAGWLDLPKDNPEYLPALAPLFEKPEYVALGLDWTEQGNRTGVRVRATCADQATVKEVHLAAMTAIAYWPSILLEGGESLAKYHKRILQLFATLKVQPSTDAAGAHFVEATADVRWDPQEFVEVLRMLFN